MISYANWSASLLERAEKSAAEADRRKRKVFHSALDFHTLDAYRRKRLGGGNSNGGDVAADADAIIDDGSGGGGGGDASNSQTSGAAVVEYMQEEAEDRPPVRTAGVGAGTGQPCGPRAGVNSSLYVSGANAGMRRLRFLIETLARLDGRYQRSNHQRLFHKAFIGACLKKIVGADLNRNMSRLLEEFDMDEVRTDVILYTPRRMGKTMSVALFLAAYLWTQPACEVSVYSPGRRASSKLLMAVHKMVVYLNGDVEQGAIVTKNFETLEVKGTGQSAAVLHSYPSKVCIHSLMRWEIFLKVDENARA